MARETICIIVNVRFRPDSVSGRAISIRLKAIYVYDGTHIANSGTHTYHRHDVSCIHLYVYGRTTYLRSTCMIYLYSERNRNLLQSLPRNRSSTPGAMSTYMRMILRLSRVLTLKLNTRTVFSENFETKFDRRFLRSSRYSHTL